jgi:hypothetical protein
MIKCKLIALACKMNRLRVGIPPTEFLWALSLCAGISELLKRLSCGLGDRGSIPGGGNYFSLRHRVQTNGYGGGGLSPGGEAARGVKLTTQPPSSAEVENAWKTVAQKTVDARYFRGGVRTWDLTDRFKVRLIAVETGLLKECGIYEGESKSFRTESNELNNNKHSLRSDTNGYDDKTH